MDDKSLLEEKKRLEEKMMFNEAVSRIPPDVLPIQQAVDDSKLEGHFMKHFDYMRRVDAYDSKLDVVLFSDEDHTSGKNIFAIRKSFKKEKKKKEKMIDLQDKEEEVEMSCCFQFILLFI